MAWKRERGVSEGCVGPGRGQRRRVALQRRRGQLVGEGKLRRRRRSKAPVELEEEDEVRDLFANSEKFRGWIEI